MQARIRKTNEVIWVTPRLNKRDNKYYFEDQTTGNKYTYNELEPVEIKIGQETEMVMASLAQLPISVGVDII